MAGRRRANPLRRQLEATLIRLVVAAGAAASAILLLVANNAIDALTRDAQQLQQQVEDIVPEVQADALDRVQQLKDDLAQTTPAAIPAVLPDPTIIIREGAPGPAGPPGPAGDRVITRTVTATPEPAQRPRRPAQARPSPPLSASPSPSPTPSPCQVDGPLAGVFCPR